VRLFLHGFTGSPASWQPIVARLPRAPHHAPALLGHEGAPHDAADWAAEIDRLAAQLTGPAHVVGYSLGGRAALSLALRHPQRVAALTLIGAGPGIDDPDERAKRRDADEARAQLLEREGLDAFLRAWESEPIFATQRALPDDVRARHRAIRRSHDPRGLARSLRVMGQGAMPSLWPELGRLAMPVRLVIGSEDTKLREVAQRMHPHLPHAKLSIVEGSGHDVALEHSDALAALLLSEEAMR
jgi:2-succinyl-6-hydroxy-2,4-cyclohexadiene-1-carboxylate synthase